MAKTKKAKAPKKKKNLLTALSPHGHPTPNIHIHREGERHRETTVTAEGKSLFLGESRRKRPNCAIVLLWLLGQEAVLAYFVCHWKARGARLVT